MTVPQCLDHVSVPRPSDGKDHWPFEPKDVYEYGRAGALADWKQTATCDSLNSALAHTLPQADRDGGRPQSAPFPDQIWFLWVNFKPDPALDTIDGAYFKVGDPQNAKAPKTHYIVMRSNLKSMLDSQKKLRWFEILKHEMGHSLGRKHDGNGKTLEHCAKRKLSREDAMGWNLPKRVPRWITSLPQTSCRWVEQRECAMVTLHNPPGEEGEGGRRRQGARRRRRERSVVRDGKLVLARPCDH